MNKTLTLDHFEAQLKDEETKQLLNESAAEKAFLAKKRKDFRGMENMKQKKPGIGFNRQKPNETENDNNSGSLKGNDGHIKGEKFIKKNITCYKCQKKGHCVRNCWSKNTSAEKNESIEGHAGFIAFETTSKNVDRWIINSGATSHITFSRSSFYNYNKQPGDWQVTLGDNLIVKVQGIGDIKVSLSLNGIETPTFLNVLHVQEIGHSLFSVAKVIDRGVNLSFKKEKVEIL
jgi:hypothetical protein